MNLQFVADGLLVGAMIGLLAGTLLPWLWLRIAGVTPCGPSGDSLPGALCTWAMLPGLILSQPLEGLGLFDDWTAVVMAEGAVLASAGAALGLLIRRPAQTRERPRDADGTLEASGR